MVDHLNINQVGVRTGVVHQSLHGYSDGHRLLESSLKLPDDVARLILGMSDLSGSNIVNGFEEYITGYPLVSSNAYVLAKTWYASEMPRPGCVWTHSLMIPDQTLSELASLNSLTSLFKRPKAEAYRGQYNEDLFLNEIDTQRATSTEQLRMDATVLLDQFLWAYYGLARPIVLAAKTSTEFEKMVFALWSQQWPNLRLTFTFCTGSLSSRQLAKRPFEVQCVPTISARDVIREAQNSVSGSLLLPSPELVQSQPIDSAVIDLMNPNGGLFRQFLWDVADDDSGKPDFIKFLTIFDVLRDPLDLRTLIDIVADHFSDSRTGRRLKSVLFGAQRNSTLLGIYDERDILFALAMTSEYQSFEANALSMYQRGAKFCLDNPNSAAWLAAELFRSNVNPLGEQLLAGLISGMDLEIACKVTGENPQFLPVLFRAKPSLASYPQLWSLGRDRKRELFESIFAQEKLDVVTVAGVVNALLETGSDVFIHRALERWGQAAIFQVLDWTESHEGRMSETCRKALTLHVPSVMAWVEGGLTRSFPALTAVAHVVAPYSYQILKHDSGVWLRTFNHLQGCQENEEASYVCTFLLALAFGNAPPNPLDLVLECFERIYKEAWDRQLSDDAWMIMEPIVPELWWGKNWDRCERLKRALVIAFMRHGWPASELRLRLKNGELMKEVIKSARDVEGGRRFFQTFE
jgi:hypothetical protein